MKKILIVDDKDENLYLLQSLLDVHEFEAITAKNGAEALSMMRKEMPDLIITDILMPVMDGFMLCHECKMDKHLKKIPFFFYTATYTDPRDEEYALGLGADRFILKPQEPDELISIITDFFKDSNYRKFRPKEITPQPDDVVFKGYNEVLIRKLEDKMVQSEKSEKELRNYAEKLEHEISERKKTEDSLRGSQLLFQTLAEVSPVGIFRASADGNTTYVNPKWCELSGLSFEEALGAGWLNAIHPDDKDIITSKWSADSHEGRDSVAEYRFLKPDGSIVWVMGKAVPETIRNPVTGYVGTITDITERIKSEEALVESETKYRQLVTQSPDGIFIADLKGRFLSVNKTICKSLAYTENELLSLSLLDIVPEKYHFLHKKRLAALLHSKTTASSTEYEVIGKDNVSHFVEVLSVPYYRDKKIIGFQGIARDITERKKTETELVKAKEKAEESDRLKTAFLNNISHEIRTPMNAIIGFSTLLNDPGIDEQIRTSFIDTITQSSDQFLNIINDILEISNIDAGIIKIAKGEVELNLILKNLYKQFGSKADEKVLKFNYSLALDDVGSKILTDKTKLTQILTNLLINAFKFTENGQIEYGYELVDGKIQFHVSDTGIGIPEDKLNKIFDRFYQIDHGLQRQYDGTGLGLSICKAYIELLGGEIRVLSIPGAGTTFYFTIPFEKPVISASTSVSGSMPRNFIFTEKKTILIAEDIESNYKLIVAYLQDSGSDILWAKNGKEAVEKALSAEKIDLILMDIRMPGIDGYEATRQIREAGMNVPVIAQTAYTDEPGKAIEAGCNGLILKPFNKNKLLTAIAEFLK